MIFSSVSVKVSSKRITGRPLPASEAVSVTVCRVQGAVVPISVSTNSTSVPVWAFSARPER